MKNEFYKPFDLERLENGPTPEGDYRNAFQIERDRIIFSYPFRRLQSKTQVFQSGEYDFYRTRLTHSIEVAKIGRSICEFLKTSSAHLNDRFYIDADLTEAVGLAHDLGHPPFGHIGERKLNDLMAEFGGFEGNAQTLRILTELIYERPGTTKGIAPTRAFLDGVMKYKALHSECITTDNNTKKYPKNHFIYDEQAHWREVIFDGQTIPEALNTPDGLNHFKSIECQIMDWADDTAYSLNDIVDGIHARYINVGSLTEWATKQTLDEQQTQWLEKLCDKIRKNSYEPYFGSRIGKFVNACTLTPRGGFLSDRTQRHAFDLTIDPVAKAESKLYKKIALDLIFRSPQLQQIEFKGGHILEKVFQTLQANSGEGSGLQVLSAQVQELLKTESTATARQRRLCDYAAGLTDALAVRTYKRLFDPDFGSIAELL
ncbi:MAG TPA: deoxyguanosinetriphosphate triphosphohydrolase [Opitutae bacterium]|nr:deoxyguanosinetriphosphate triphosphohydrolase [Opitutae bacterium]